MEIFTAVLLKWNEWNAILGPGLGHDKDKCDLRQFEALVYPNIRHW